MKIESGASNLSAGEKQMLTIARAMAADPEMLILDEATSSVDSFTEYRIQQGMKALMKGRTSFVIVHRLSTIRDADLILYMENGNIEESGTHEQLMKTKGRYAALYESQFRNVEDWISADWSVQSGILWSSQKLIHSSILHMTPNQKILANRNGIREDFSFPLDLVLLLWLCCFGLAFEQLILQLFTNFYE